MNSGSTSSWAYSPVLPLKEKPVAFFWQPWWEPLLTVLIRDAVLAFWPAQWYLWRKELPWVWFCDSWIRCARDSLRSNTCRHSSSRSLLFAVWPPTKYIYTYNIVTAYLLRALPHFVLVARQHICVLRIIEQKRIDKASSVVLSIPVEPWNDRQNRLLPSLVSFSWLIFRVQGGLSRRKISDSRLCGRASLQRMQFEDVWVCCFGLGSAPFHGNIVTGIGNRPYFK